MRTQYQINIRMWTDKQHYYAVKHTHSRVERAVRTSHCVREREREGMMGNLITWVVSTLGLVAVTLLHTLTQRAAGGSEV